MTLFRPLLTTALAASLCVLVAPTRVEAVNTATADLIALDKATATGYLDARVSLYAPPNTKGQYAAPTVYPAQLLFARPGQFRFVLRPGAKNEYRAAASGGVVSWIDLGTGLSGQGKTVDVVDPAAQALLGTVGGLLQFAPAKEVAVSTKNPVRGVNLAPRSFGTSVIAATAWFGNDQPVGFEFVFSDRSRVFISVLSFKQNVPTKPGDFTL